MLTRRKFLLGSVVTSFLSGNLLLREAVAGERVRYYFDRETFTFRKRKPPVIKPKMIRVRKKSSTKKKKVKLDPKYNPTQVVYETDYESGTIVIETAARFLYLVEPDGYARRYGVAVGKEALAWSGTAEIARKVEWPSWKPTPGMIKREPGKYRKYRNGVKGGPQNPLGARAMYLYKGTQDTQYRIHGTNAPWSIGTATSNGCIRMVNDHAIDLYNRVAIGTKVVVI